MNFKNFIIPLNTDQQKAVLHIKGPSMVLAGAGSGKTRVLVSRVVYLIKYLNINPYNLLVLTFTNKAAHEMIIRLKSYLGNDFDLKNLYIGTFHSIFSHFLRTYSKYLNYSNNYIIYNRQDCQKIVKTIISEMNLDHNKYNCKNILSKISLIKNCGLYNFDHSTPLLQYCLNTCQLCSY